MNRKFPVIAVALGCVVGAALWNVNARLDHPPLSKADRAFAASVAGADSVVASQWSCQGACSANALVKYPPLGAAQTRRLIANLRFLDAAPDAVITSAGVAGVTLDLSFRRAGREVARYTLCQTRAHSEVRDISPPMRFSTGKTWKPFYFGFPCPLHPRFENPLRRALDEFWPHRVGPQP